MTKTLGRRLFGFGTSGRAAARTPAGATTAADCLRLYEEAGDGDPEMAAAAATVREAADADLTDALLALGGAALTRDLPPLALAAADAVLTRRKGSRAAWQLRGRALEAAGDLPAAVAAFEGYLERTDAASAGAAEVTARIGALRADHRWRQDVLRALDGSAPDVAALAAGPLPAFESAVERHLDDRLTAPGGAGGAAAGLAPVVGLYADRRRHRLRPPVADPLYGGTGRLRIGEFRNLIAGRSVCLVANSGTVRGGALGADIDAYDLVVRFSSFVLDPAATGERTDVHVTGHRGALNWDRQVTTRLVFCDKPDDWRQALRTHLVPGAQRFTGDDSLRRPVRGVGGLTPALWPPRLTCGFEMVWLLDFLDVSPRLDLIGFDFFATDPYRLPEASHIATPSDYTSEKAWVMERAQHVTGPVIALR
ncbi:hypothetical protein [Streptomyces sp. NBC_01198]|uniref:hypothetical protein n=1 Tax=Streptomyces sp. NBC_01198 TaxID=2903769 RepID=UPI002E131AF7|nr:hypothetical protein OG702_21750 [Streptomyces sp. NBC_01198]